MDLDGKDSHSDPVPEREQLGPCYGRVHARAFEQDQDWAQRGPSCPARRSSTRARDLMQDIAGRVGCADQGMQYDTTIDEWHTCPASGADRRLQPCGEYMHLGDNSACNLASLCLTLNEDGTFDVADFKRGGGRLRHAGVLVEVELSHGEDGIARSRTASSAWAMPTSITLLMARGLAYGFDAGRA